MSRFRLMGRADAPPPDPDAIPYLAPSASWTGEIDSGFAGGVPPALIDRTGPQVACRPLFANYETFDNDVILVWAAGCFGGVSHVVVNVEGTEATILNPRWTEYTDINGAARKLFGYSVKINKAAVLAQSIDGTIRIVASAHALETGILTQVIRSTIYIRSDRYDGVYLTVDRDLPNSGTRFNNLFDALLYCQTEPVKLRAHIEIQKAGDFTCEQLWMAPRTSATTYVTIETKAGITATPLALSTTGGAFRPKFDGLKFGRGIVIQTDRSNMYPEDLGGLLCFEGCFITSSGGRDMKINHAPNQSYWLRSNSGKRQYHFLDCEAYDLYEAYSNSDLIRNCTARKVSSDCANNNHCIHGLTVSDLKPGNWRTLLPSVLVQYNGTDAVATIERPAATGTAGPIHMRSGATLGSQTIAGTFNATAPSLATIGSYTNEDLVAYINTLANWTASLINNDLAAVFLTSGPAPSAALAQTSVKTAATISAAVDVHSDAAQWFGKYYNVIYQFATSHDTEAQFVLIDKDEGTAMNDMYASNIQGSSLTSAGGLPAQWSAPQSHVVWERCTFKGTGGLRTDFAGVPPATSSLKYNPDGFCLFDRCVFESLTWGGAQNANLRLDSNYFLTGTIPAGSTNSNTGGGTETWDDVLKDWANNDYTPVASGPLDLGAGEWIGAYRTDGTWAGIPTPT